MFHLFTDSARRAVVQAQEEARRLRHAYIGTEHLLLGLARTTEGTASRGLTELGLSLDVLREQVATLVGVGKKEPGPHIPFTPAAKKAIEVALAESKRLESATVDTDHLLLGVLQQQGDTADQVLAALGTDAEAVRRQFTGPEDSDRR